MGNFQDTFETRKRPLISGFSICMIIPLIQSSAGSDQKLVLDLAPNCVVV